MLWLLTSGWKLRELARDPWVRCGVCGHQLFKGQAACPECGAAWTGPHIAHLQSTRRRSGTVRLLIGIALAILLLLGLALAIVPVLNYGRTAPPAPTNAIGGR